MGEQNSIGISINDFEIDVAATSTTHSENRIQVVRLQDVTSPTIVIRETPSELLPVTLVAPRSLTSGDWFSNTLRRIHAGWPLTADLKNSQTCIALSSSVSRQVREQCRHLARDNGWQNVKVCGHNLTISIDRFRESVSPVTALVLQIEFDHVDISLVSTLKGVVRIRDHCSIPALSHRLLDESILAGVYRTLDLNDGKVANWRARWLDAYRIRKQLETTAVTALELSPVAWGVAGTLEVSHDDLWGTLEHRVEILVCSMKQLLSNNRVVDGQLDKILLLGGSPLSWNAVRRRLDEEFLVGTQIVPIHQSSAGAAIVAKSDDVALTDTPQSSSISASSPSGVSEVRGPAEPSGQGARFHFEVRAESGAISPVAEDPSFDRSLQAVWTYIRGVSSVSIERSHDLLRRVRCEAEELLKELDPTDGASIVQPNLHLESAWEAMDEGRYAEAVNESHLARDIEPDDPAVFREMINVHIEAARRSQSLEHSLQWLECAHSHDQTDTAVHQLLSDYAYQRAKQLQQEGRKHDALRTVDRSLAFRPFNQDASKLAEALRQPDHS